MEQNGTVPAMVTCHLISVWRVWRGMPVTCLPAMCLASLGISCHLHLRPACVQTALSRADISCNLLSVFLPHLSIPLIYLFQ